MTLTAAAIERINASIDSPDKGKGLSRKDFSPQPQAFILILLLAVFLTLPAILISAKLNSSYLNDHAFYGDTASYYYLQNRAFWKSEFQGTMTAIQDQIQRNSRNPLRIIPLLAINPEFLIHHNGHLLTTALMFFAFLYLWGLTVYKRSGSLLYSSAAMLLVMAWPLLFDPIMGLGGNYCDLPASLLVGAALFSLILSEEGEKYRWLFSFGCFAALAAMSRFVAAGYTFFICGPILAFYLYRHWMTHKSLIRLLSGLFFVTVPIAVISGYYLLSFWKPVLQFYAQAGYALGHPYADVIKNFFSLFLKVVNPASLLVLATVFAGYLLSRSWTRNIKNELIVSAWAAVAHIVLVIGILRVYDDWLVVYYSLPGLLLLSIVPYSRKAIPALTGLKRRAYRSLGFAALAGLVFFSGSAYAQVLNKYSTVTVHENRWLSFQRESTAILIKNSKQHFKINAYDDVPKFDTFFYEFGPRIVNEAAFRYRYAISWDYHYFNTHLSAWKASYPGMTLEEIQEKVFAHINHNLDYVLILENPDAPEAEEIFNNDWSREIVRQTFNALVNHPDSWSHERISPDQQSMQSPWGPMHLFRNLKKVSS